jgi:hypothetical protein
MYLGLYYWGVITEPVVLVEIDYHGPLERRSTNKVPRRHYPYSQHLIKACFDFSKVI